MATDKTECDEDLKEKFRLLTFQLGKHYDGRYFKWLRFCLHGYIPLGDLDCDDVTAMSLFNELQRTGEITPHKVRLLLDIAKLTGFSEAVGQINQYMADNNVQLVDEETLSASRKELFHTIRQIGQDELKKVIHNYDELNKFEFTNIWDAVFILDKGNLLSTSSNITRFTDCLGQSVQDRRGEERPTTSSRSNNERGIQNKDRPNRGGSKMKKRKRRPNRSETVNVPNTSNEEQGTQKEFKSETGDVPTITSNKKPGTRKRFESETGDIPTTTSNKEQVMQKKVESERPATSSRSNNEQGIQKKDKRGGYKMKKRRGKKKQPNRSESETVDVLTTNSNKGTQNEVKSETC
ncbi:uncharacterized protein [Antedon mediterranea]|uniref:uncharacterized protein n=1 Tax=Antedon mediterranea TaxID=105859 RepID=UPI003AF4B0DE